ncbi:MAG: hypothetical protein KGD63_07905 [Candidatus Lokiarchaeota archaeon]|nr:hypothetical protein [Candidatus Lokiarchaeota archaeon]
MPIGLFLYEIDESFGPNLLADYNLTNIKVSSELLELLNEKHIEKKLKEAVVRKEDIRYFSSLLESKALEKKNLYFGCILRNEEDLLSLKSVFANIQEQVIENYNIEDKKNIKDFLKDTITSILNLIEKLKEPKIIKETINEKTKVMLDEGKLQEARELIDLGEVIPNELSELVKEADDLFNEGDYKKSKKKFMKASDLAELIQEIEIVSFLRKKAENIGNYPDLIKEKERIQKEINRQFIDDEKNEFRPYELLLPNIKRLIEISNYFEDIEEYDILVDLLEKIQKAIDISRELIDIDVEISQKIGKMNN